MVVNESSCYSIINSDDLSATEAHWVMFVTHFNAISLMLKDTSKRFSSIEWSITSNVADKSSLGNAMMDVSPRATAKTLFNFKRAISVEWSTR